MEIGLKRSRGNKALYKNLLHLLDEKYADATDRIKKTLNDGQRGDAAALAHSVKGTSGMLGAMDLFEAASELELAITDNNDAMVEEKLNHFQKELSIVIQSIADLNLHRLVSDVQELQSSLDELRPHLVDEKAEECQVAVKKIKSLHWPLELQSSVTRLCKLTAKSNFKKSLIRLDEIQKGLKEQSN